MQGNKKVLAFFFICGKMISERMFDEQFFEIDKALKERMKYKMYSYIKGILVEKMSNYLVVENNGIGYQIFMSRNSILKAGEQGEQIKIYTHYHVREDAISLYGFLTNEELNLFERLISVSGVGAKSAITMLSSITPSEFVMCIIKDDITRLTKIPGIGKKSAQRIVLELKDKLKAEQEIVTDEEETVTVIETSIDAVEEAISALQILGYHKKEIEKILPKFDYQSMTTEDIIRNGLRFLGGNGSAFSS